MATEALGQVRVFSALSEEERQKILALCREQTFSKDDWVFRQGDGAGHLYILRQGRVGLAFRLPPYEADRHITIVTVEPPQIFAWSALVPPHEATLSARCLEPCTVYALAQGDLFALFEREEGIGCRVMQKLAEIISDRLRRLQQQLILEMSAALLA